MPPVTEKRPRKFQRLDRPYCPACDQLMVCYATRGVVMYYKCQQPGCGCTAKTSRRDV